MGVDTVLSLVAAEGCGLNGMPVEGFPLGGTWGSERHTEFRLSVQRGLLALGVGRAYDSELCFWGFFRVWEWVCEIAKRFVARVL
jgi:hypothetical protein